MIKLCVQTLISAGLIDGKAKEEWEGSNGKRLEDVICSEMVHLIN